MKKIMIVVAAVFAAVSFTSCNRTVNNSKQTVDTVRIDTVHTDSVK